MDKLCIYRFRDKIAINPPGDGETFYLSKDAAVAIAEQMLKIVADVEAVKFSESPINPVDVDVDLRLPVSRSAQAKMISRFELMGSGENPGGYTAEAERSGDEGIYNEVRINIFQGEDKSALADVLVGLDPKGEPRIMVTAGGNADSEHAFMIYPLRPADEALSSWEKESERDSAMRSV